MSESRGRIIYRKYGTYIILAVLVIGLSIGAEGFFSLNNLTNILRTTSVYVILGCGMTFVMLSGCIDLSVGSVVALSGCISALYMSKGGSMMVAVLLGIAVGILCGFINGFCIAKLKVPFFITTIGMMYAASGVALVITHETPISGLPSSFKVWGAKTLGIIPTQAIIAAIFFAICFFVLRHTKLGRYTYAIGSNERTAKLSGVNVDRYMIIIYTLNGFAAALAGIVVASRLSIGSPLIGDGYDIDAIAAAALGGVSMSGGEGSIVKTIVGAFILCVIRTGLNILGISTSNQKIIIGIVLIIVVAVDMLDKRKAE